MLNCIICGKEFPIIKRRGRHSKTCSDICSYKLKIKSIQEWAKNHPENFKKAQIKYHRIHKNEIKERQKNWINVHKEIVKVWNRKAQRNLLNKNPDYFNNKAKEYYQRNKKKNTCRKKTYELIKKLDITLENYCKSCRIDKNLEIHHGIYPETIEGIILEIKNGKIYNLCKNCHEFIHSVIAF